MLFALSKNTTLSGLLNASLLLVKLVKRCHGKADGLAFTAKSAKILKKAIFLRENLTTRCLPKQAGVQ